ncbi:hypothetical protein D3C73_1100170 [compost metagenome]
MWRQVGGQDVLGAALGVFGLVVVEALGRGDVGDGQGARAGRLAHDGDRQFLARDEGLDHHLVAVGPVVGADLGDGTVGALAHQEDADGRALGVRLDHIGRVDDVAAGDLMPVEQAAARHDDARRVQNGLGLVLVHRQGRGQDAGMGIGQLQRLEDALDAAVLAPFAVQGVEDDVGLQRRQHLGQVAARVDTRDLADLPLQGVRAAAPRGQRDLAFRRQAAHQDSDVKGVQGRTHGNIRRLARPYALNTVNRLETIRGRGRNFVTFSLLPLWEKVAGGA